MDDAAGKRSMVTTLWMKEKMVEIVVVMMLENVR